MLVGDAEVLNENHASNTNRKSRIVKYYGFVTDILSSLLNRCNNLISNRGTPNRFLIYLVEKFKNVESKMDELLNSLSKSHILRHPLCKHRYNCFTYTISVNRIRFKIYKIFLKPIFYSKRVLFKDSLLAIFFKSRLN